MLRALRNQTQSIFFKCFLVLLICGFALWGVGDITGGLNQKPVLSTEKEKVTTETILNELNRLRYTLPKRPSLKETVENGMLQNVLNKFEQEVLINAEANFLNLYVPISIQTKAITKEKAFQDPLGNFSKNKFLQSLKNTGLTEKDYLKMIKSEANFQQISMPFLSNDYYDDTIIKDLIDWQNEVRDIEYEILEYIDPNKITKPTSIALKKFFKKNKDKYQFPKIRDIKYLELKPSNFKNEVKISKKLLDDRYEIEKSSYIKEEIRKFYQVITQDESKANDFVSSLSKTNEFEEIAKKKFDLSLKDIDIGSFTKIEFQGVGSDILFNAKINEVIGPIKNKFGYSIYKIINIEPRKTINYDDAIKDLKNKLTKELSLEILYEKLDEIEDLIAAGSTLEEIKRKHFLNTDTSLNKLNKISENGFIYHYDKDKSFLTKGRDFLNAVWYTELNQISDLINTKDDTYVLIEITNEYKNEKLDFKVVKKIVYNDWLSTKIIQVTKDKLSKQILLKDKKLSSKLSIKRNEESFNNIKDALFINKIFDIKNKNLTFLNTNNAVVAIKILDIKTDKYKIKKEINKSLNSTLSKSFFNDFSNIYLSNLAKKHKLVRNFNDLEKFLLNTEIN